MEKSQIINQMISDSILDLEKTLQSEIKGIYSSLLMTDQTPSPDTLREMFEISTTIECLVDNNAKESIFDYLNNMSDTNIKEIQESDESFGFLLKDALIYSQDSEESYRSIVENSFDYLTW